MTSNTLQKVHGHCLCKGVSFMMDAPNHLDSCHCDTCRCFGGGPFIGLPGATLSFTAKNTLRWYRSSDWAERGFCSECGSSMFYRLVDIPDVISVSAGAVSDIPNGLPMTMELFIDSKPDYYNFEGERKRLTGEEVFALFGADAE